MLTEEIIVVREHYITRSLKAFLCTPELFPKVSPISIYIVLYNVFLAYLQVGNETVPVPGA